MPSKILLVDDDKTLLSFLGEYLQNEEHTVLAAGSGAEALRAVYRERPDLVVLDVMMPGMDGWELVARLRELADFPIILLSAKSSEADKLRGFRMGVDDYVTKPFSFAELAARIQAVLGRTQANPATVGPMYAAGNLNVDMAKRQVTRGKEQIPLTPTEFRLAAMPDSKARPAGFGGHAGAGGVGQLSPERDGGGAALYLAAAPEIGR